MSPHVSHERSYGTEEGKSVLGINNGRESIKSSRVHSISDNVEAGESLGAG